MKKQTKFFLLSILLISTSVLPAVAQPTNPPTGLRMIQADSTAIIVELTVAEYTVETVTRARQPYQQINIADARQTTTAGVPQVPIVSTLLGLSTTANVQVHILAADYETLPDRYQLPPVLAVDRNALPDNLFEDVQNDSVQFAPFAGQTANDEQSSLGAVEHGDVDAFYPVQYAALGGVGMMRKQAVGQVEFYTGGTSNECI